MAEKSETEKPSKIAELMAEYASNEAFEGGSANGQAEAARIIAQAEALVNPHLTYTFSFTPDAKLAVIEVVMPLEDAIAETGKTLKLFGWREGIMHSIGLLEEYLKTGQLDNHMTRIKLNSRPKQMPNGKVYPACAACGYSPEADKAMWMAQIAALDEQLAAPPEGDND